MAKDRIKSKERTSTGGFALIPHAVLESKNYPSLTPRAAKLLLDLVVQFRGKNNGDLTTAWKVMRTKGWRSRAMLNKARDELLKYGFIECTRQGGRHTCSLYAVTWKPVDECDGKLDVGATKVPSQKWKCDPPAGQLWPARGSINSKSRESPSFVTRPRVSQA